MVIINQLPSSIALIVYDFDGVMTDNRVLINQTGEESVYVHRGDGLGISLIRKIGIPQLILSTETNPIVKFRAKKLKIPVIHNVEDKKDTLMQYCEKQSVSLEDVIYVGNDVNDIDAMKIVGYAVCPKDAHPQIKKIANHVLKSNGGYGVIRELTDKVINQKK